ncbi:MAG: tRNA3(Ser)-specific nuclease WapA [Chlamydiae bacterium]|nr:tRNA3(Ser)-specific nuclease WapA [Chlamydiota bacterium]
MCYYDIAGHCTKHIIPNAAITEIIHTEYTKHARGQNVAKKTTIDPLGNQTIETYDATNHLVHIEKKDAQCQTTSQENYFFDRAGNKAKRLTTIYEQNTPIRTYTTLWEHDTRGRVIRETEENQKTTSFQYDKKGRLIKKIFPGKIFLSQTFDYLDRLIQTESPGIHYTYTYGSGRQPIQAHDHHHNFTWERTYNLFDELVSETLPHGATLFWDYDQSGRCRALTLPDNSSIHYAYSDLHLAAVTRCNSTQKPLYTHTYTHFDENGHVAEEELILNLGIRTTHHNLLERPSTQQSPWMESSITYGPSGLVTHINNSLFGSKDYRYDSLDQLTQEGPQSFSFDSLGNPLDAQTNSLNQITSTADSHLIYDDNGNLTRHHRYDRIIQYTYDSLSRLTSIHQPQKKRTHFTYDPFNRLYSKQTYNNHGDTWSRDTAYYLYDQDKEIGTYDEQNTLLELKVIGLGIQGDIGSAVSIELQSTPYVPLHDFAGSIIALISSNGTIAEKYNIDAFGKETSSATSLNPWRFNSKRTEEELIFFGKRFYHPALGRWLTPDPAGSIDSPNLYLYVLNSPLNRLDLFGLFSKDFKIEIPVFHALDFPFLDLVTLPCKILDKGIHIDAYIGANICHKLKYTPEELETGKANLCDHLHEIASGSDPTIFAVTVMNGICNSYKGVKKITHSVIYKIPESPLIIGLYNPTDKFCNDASRTRAEQKGIDTPIVCATRQFFVAFAEHLEKVNPQFIWMHISHSEGGVIGTQAIKGMTSTEKELMQKHLYWVAMAPAKPLQKDLAFQTINVYSEKDGITKRYAEPYLNDPNYNIQIIPCTSSWNEKTLFITDHSFRGATYQKALQDEIFDASKKYGFIK